MTEDMLPAYIALIRRELKVAAGDDALAALKRRLAPTDPSDKLPARAPAILRLRAAARFLDEGHCPDSSLHEFAGDLRLLQMFARDDYPMPREAMQNLLKDVMGAAPLKDARRKPAKDAGTGGNVVPFSEKGATK